jgi:hypothetical protein
VGARATDAGRACRKGYHTFIQEERICITCFFIHSQVACNTIYVQSRVLYIFGKNKSNIAARDIRRSRYGYFSRCLLLASPNKRLIWFYPSGRENQSIGVQEDRGGASQSSNR